MTRKQPVGLEKSETRTALLEAAERLMGEEGYAAVTSRRLGAYAGVRPQLVHYYFRTMDDLFIAMVRRSAERNLAYVRETLASGDPLRALWAQSRNYAGAALSLELMALANHRKAVRAEMAKHGVEMREMQREALARYFEARGIAGQISPGVVTAILAGVGTYLALEERIGMETAHAETAAFVEAVLERLSATGEAHWPDTAAEKFGRTPKKS